jgi:hypothetical protein
VEEKDTKVKEVKAKPDKVEGTPDTGSNVQITYTIDIDNHGTVRHTDTFIFKARVRVETTADLSFAVATTKFTGAACGVENKVTPRGARGLFIEGRK